jgi:dGTPase
VRRFPKPLVQHSPERRKLNFELRKYLYKNLYYNPVVHRPNRRAVKILEQLFKYYLAHPKEIGEGTRRRIRQTGLHRAVCDYLAGMTDRYVMLEYQRLFGETLKA